MAQGFVRVELSGVQSSLAAEPCSRRVSLRPLRVRLSCSHSRGIAWSPAPPLQVRARRQGDRAPSSTPALKGSRMLLTLYPMEEASQAGETESQ